MALMRVIRANLPGKGLHEISVADSRIAGVQPLGAEAGGFPYCSAGFVDLQINGFSGIDFNANRIDAASLLQILDPIFSTGVTRFLPTLVTNEIEFLVHRLQTFEKARSQSPDFDRAVPGYHLEGPWLSSGPSHGAHDPQHMRLPNDGEFEKLLGASSGRIRLITIAPELPGALELIRRARAEKIAISLGHTDGSAKDIHEAAEAGATLSTHLGNGCPQELDRHTAPFWAQLAEDHLKACIICDNFHVTPELVKIIVRVKGLPNCMLVTDAMEAAMMPAGRYQIARTHAELLPTGQVVRLDRNSMAGSALTMNRAIANFRRATACSLADAINAATSNPRAALGCSRVAGGILPGQSADLVLFEPGDDSLTIQETILAGETVWKT